MLEKCANPECHAEFKRMGTGRLYTLPVSRPEEWGLPHHAKQKVVWLCSKCAHHKKVRFDVEHAKVVVISRREHQFHATA